MFAGPARLRCAGDDSFEVEVGVFGAGNESAKLVEVASVVLVIVQPDRLRAHMRFESIVGERQRRKIKTHGAIELLEPGMFKTVCIE